jgi:hypothetical protein
MHARRRPDPPSPFRPPSREEEAAAARAWEDYCAGRVDFFQVMRTKKGRTVVTRATGYTAEIHSPSKERPDCWP